MFRSPIGPADKLLMRLVAAQRLPVVGRVLQQWLKLRGIDIPPQTFIRVPFLIHGAQVTVHGSTRLGENVTLFHNVTIGRADIWQEPHPDFQGAVIEREAILCAGAAVLPRRGPLVVAEGSVIGANAVLTCSTGPWEVWAGAPARKVSDRPRP